MGISKHFEHTSIYLQLLFILFYEMSGVQECECKNKRQSLLVKISLVIFCWFDTKEKAENVVRSRRSGGRDSQRRRQQLFLHSVRKGCARVCE